MSPPNDAVLLARSLLARSVVPPGGRSTSSLPAGTLLSHPFTYPDTPNLIDLDQFWAVPSSVDTVAAFLQAHPPTGMTLDGSGFSSDHTGVTVRGVMATLTSLGPAIESAQLLLAVTPAAGQGSILRADAQVVWRPTRPTTERVGSRDTVAVISRQLRVFGSTASSVPKPRQLTVTDPTTVSHLAALFNDLPTAVPGPIHCPVDIGITYRVQFAPSAAAPPDVVISEGSCSFVGVTIDGQSSQQLRDNDTFATAVARLLGISQPFSTAS